MCTDVADLSLLFSVWNLKKYNLVTLDPMDRGGWAVPMGLGRISNSDDLNKNVHSFQTLERPTFHLGNFVDGGPDLRTRAVGGYLLFVEII